jgi:hypothetical protein
MCGGGERTLVWLLQHDDDGGHAVTGAVQEALAFGRDGPVGRVGVAAVQVALVVLSLVVPQHVHALLPVHVHACATTKPPFS